MRQIVSVLLNHGFGDLVERMHLGGYLRWGRRVLFRNRIEDHPLSLAERIRQALESLGPTFVKFGQVLSTRPDLIPDELIEELKNLRENVGPFSTEEALAIFEDDLGTSVDEAFAEFEREPFAAGSLAQVHRAVHRDGTQLAVKILRPGIADQIERDLDLMSELASLIQRYIAEARIFDPVGLVNHFARAIRREVNLTREMRTLQEFQRLFQNDASLYVPRVFIDYCSVRVLTMEFVDGMRVDDPPALTAQGVNCAGLAKNGARIFMKQAFELGIFHGDPHPGNIRVMRDGSLCLLDYGMIGMLDPDKRDQIIDLLMAIVRRDHDAAVRVVRKLGQASRDVDTPLLRADIRDFIDGYYGIELSHLDVGALLRDFIRMLTSHGIRVPGDLVMLIRAIITLEGVGRTLDPNFNLAQVLQPFIASTVRQRFNPARIAADTIAELKTLAEVAHRVPVTMSRALEKLSNDDLRIQLEHRRLDSLMTELDRSSNRIVIGLILAALIVASALVLRGGAASIWISIPIFAISSLLGIWLIYGIFRSGRL